MIRVTGNRRGRRSPRPQALALPADLDKAKGLSVRPRTREAPRSGATWPRVQGLWGEPLLGPFYGSQWADSANALRALRARASPREEIL